MTLAHDPEESQSPSPWADLGPSNIPLGYFLARDKPDPRNGPCTIPGCVVCDDFDAASIPKDLF